MITVETCHAIDPVSARNLDTNGLRRHFHLRQMFVRGEIRLVYSDYD
ncbi:hypothetical protein G6L32_24980 [Agrobacterium tumefaciens]|nr:hypothetical protein [Agrobacterium tumefaciens]